MIMECGPLVVVMLRITHVTNRFRSPKTAFVVTIGGIIVTSAGGLVTLIRPAVGIGFVAAGTVLAVLGAISSFVSSGAIDVEFSEADWRPSPIGDLMLEIPSARHGKARPAVDVQLMTSHGNYEAVMCDVRVSDDGSIQLGASKPFGGRARVW